MILILLGRDESQLAAFTPETEAISTRIVTSVDDLASVAPDLSENEGSLLIVDYKSFNIQPDELYSRIRKVFADRDIWLYYESASVLNIAFLLRIGYTRVLQIHDHPAQQIREYFLQED